MSFEEPVRDMIERGNKRTNHKVPPYLADRRPEALETGGVVVALFCSDPRLDPRKILDLDGTPGPPVAIVRNPGGRAEHAIKSLAGMQAVLNCLTIVVVHHTDCGMTHVTDREIQDHLVSINPAEEDIIRKTKFGEIRVPFEETLKEDLDILRASPWIKKETRLIGLKYETHKGTIEQILDLKPNL